MQNKNLFLAAAAACLTTGFAAAQDECATATAISVGVTAFDTTTATPSAEPWACAGGTHTGGDLWYTYTAVASTSVTVALCGSTYDTALEVYDAGGCGSALLSCNDDSCGLQSQITFVPVAGSTYTIRVGGFSSSEGTGIISLSEVGGPPFNDECGSAIALGEGVTSIDTAGASTSSSFSCTGLGTTDLWFTYTPSVSGDFSISTCSTNTNFDTVLELFTGDCGALSSIDCNDDTCGLQSTVGTCGIAGNTYTFRVGGFNGQTGLADVEIVNSVAAACVTTLFATNNGGAVGGAVFFDGTFTQVCPVGSMATNTSVATGQPITAEIYTTPGTSVGAEQNIALWTLLGTASGVAAGINNPSVLTPNAPFAFPAGTVGIAIVALDFNHRYTNGNGTNQSAVSGDGVISLALGKGQNTPFVSTPFSPRIWNGSICRDVLGATSYCPGTLNSTGSAGTLTLGGSNFVSSDCITLTASSLPPNSFGFFLCSQNQGMVQAGQGFICLDNPIGRGVGGAIFNSGAAGVIQTASNLQLPQPTGLQQVMAGETWNFQGWHRDSVAGMATSNTTNAVSVTFQ